MRFPSKAACLGSLLSILVISPYAVAEDGGAGAIFLAPSATLASSAMCSRPGYCSPGYGKEVGYRPDFQEAMGVLAALNAGNAMPAISSPLRTAISEERKKLSPSATDIEVVEHFLAEKSSEAGEAK